MTTVNITNIGSTLDCVHSSFYCDNKISSDRVNYLNFSCPIQEMDNPPYDFGIFLPALQSGVANSTDFPQKFFYCFWWGLQNLRYEHLNYVCVVVVSLKFLHNIFFLVNFAVPLVKTLQLAPLCGKFVLQYSFL